MVGRLVGISYVALAESQHAADRRSRGRRRWCRLRALASAVRRPGRGRTFDVARRSWPVGAAPCGRGRAPCRRNRRRDREYLAALAVSARARATASTAGAHRAPLPEPATTMRRRSRTPLVPASVLRPWVREGRTDWGYALSSLVAAHFLRDGIRTREKGSAAAAGRMPRRRRLRPARALGSGSCCRPAAAVVVASLTIARLSAYTGTYPTAYD